MPRAAFALLILALAPVAAAVPPVADGAPISDEDVVRWLAAGRPVPEILESIRTGPVAFDLSDEMIEEMRLAGVPPVILEAMRTRQASLDRARDAESERPAGDGSPAKDGSFVEIVPVASDGAPALLIVPEAVDDRLARALELGAGEAERTASDLAVFLACRTPEHVPDAWRTVTPLGRDFVSVARHRMLEFHAGARRLAARDLPARQRKEWNGPPGKERETTGFLLLEIPSLRAVLERGAHDLVVGVAMRVGGRYLQIAEARRDGVEAGEAGVRLSVRFTPSAPGEPAGVAVKIVDVLPR